jgi:hypothetical protein
MNNKGIFKGCSFTTIYNHISRELKNKVGVQSVINQEQKIVEVVALWDTGATCSSIHYNEAKLLDLKPVSQTRVYTPTGNDICNQYFINLYLPNRVRIEKVLVTEGKMTGCGILIGMDIISLGDFSVTNYGRTVFSFRMPSMSIIDFTKNSYFTPQKNDSKTGRNARCPCGSGKKYKNCCGDTVYDKK